MAKKNIERVKEINSHKWHWTKKAQGLTEDEIESGKTWHCQYCNSEITVIFEMENENNDKIYVGSECMKHIGWIPTSTEKTEINQVKKDAKITMTLVKKQFEDTNAEIIEQRAKEAGLNIKKGDCYFNNIYFKQMAFSNAVTSTKDFFKTIESMGTKVIDERKLIFSEELTINNSMAVKEFKERLEKGKIVIIQNEVQRNKLIKMVEDEIKNTKVRTIKHDLAYYKENMTNEKIEKLENELKELEASI